MSTRPEWASAVAPAALVTGLAAAWTAMDHSPPHDDDFTLFRVAACMADLLPVAPANAATHCVTSAPYPPLLPLLAAGVFWAAGDRTIDLAMTSLVPWYAVLAVATWWGLRGEGGRWTAAAGAVLAPALWLLCGLRAAYYTELAMAATTMLAVAGIARSDGLRRHGPAAIAGLAVAAGMAVKWSSGFFLALPVAWALGDALVHAPRSRALGVGLVVAVIGTLGLDAAAILGHAPGAPAAVATAVVIVGLVALAARPGPWASRGGEQRLRGALLLLAGSALAAPWYLAMGRRLARFLGANVGHAFDGDVMPLTETWVYYPAVLLATLGAPLALAAGLGAVRQLGPGRGRFAGLALLAALGGACVLAGLPYRAARYVSPVLPLLAPMVLLAGTGPGWPLGAWRAAVALWALAFQAPVEWPIRPGPPPPHLAGNNRSGMVAAREVLANPPWRVRLQGDVPLRDVPDAAGIVDVIGATTRGVTVGVLQGPADLRAPLQVELVRRGVEPGTWNIVGLDPGAPRLEQLSGSPSFLAEVWSPSLGDHVVAAAAREAQLTAAGATLLWDSPTSRRRQRVWRLR